MLPARGLLDAAIFVKLIESRVGIGLRRASDGMTRFPDEGCAGRITIDVS